MKRVVICTCAYNAEKTIKRAIDSILAQNFCGYEPSFFLIDNGSVDNTGKIIDNYAKEIGWIIPAHNKVNLRSQILKTLQELLRRFPEEGYFFTLDADDEYAPDFFEKMIAFMEANQLDVGACGCKYFDAESGKLNSELKIKQNIILESKEEFEKKFPLYFPYMRTIWGKVYSLSLLRKCTFENAKKILYGQDTLFGMEAFCNANCVGILKDTLYKYYQSKTSVSFQYDEKRILSDRIIFDSGLDFLKAKCGTVSENNRNFMLAVYLGSIQNTIIVLLNSQLEVPEKFQLLREIFNYDITRELFRRPGLTQLKQLLAEFISIWTLAQDLIHQEHELEITAEIFALMGIYPTSVSGWDDSQIFMLLSKIRRNQVKFGLITNTDAQIASITSKNPLLVGLSVDFITHFDKITILILQSKYLKALRQLKSTIEQDIDIPDDYVDAFLLLGLNLSAKLEMSNDFIYFKKLRIMMYLDLLKCDEAKKELADWDKILPDDPDFKKFRQRLERL